MLSKLIDIFSEFPLRFKILYFVCIIFGPILLRQSYVKKGKYQEIELLMGIIFILTFLIINLFILKIYSS